MWLKDGQGMEDQEEKMKNKKYRSLKMFPSDIILKFKNIVKFNWNKLLKLKIGENLISLGFLSNKKVKNCFIMSNWNFFLLRSKI